MTVKMNASAVRACGTCGMNSLYCSEHEHRRLPCSHHKEDSFKYCNHMKEFVQQVGQVRLVNSSFDCCNYQLSNGCGSGAHHVYAEQCSACNKTWRWSCATDLCEHQKVKLSLHKHRAELYCLTPNPEPEGEAMTCNTRGECAPNCSCRASCPPKKSPVTIRMIQDADQDFFVVLNGPNGPNGGIKIPLDEATAVWEDLGDKIDAAYAAFDLLNPDQAPADAAS